MQKIKFFLLLALMFFMTSFVSSVDAFLITSTKSVRTSTKDNETKTEEVKKISLTSTNSSGIYTRHSLENIKSLNGLIQFILYFIINRKEYLIPFYALDKVLTAALESEVTKIDDKLWILSVSELWSYAFNTNNLRSYTYCLDYLRNGQVAPADRVRAAHVMARLLRTVLTSPLMHMIKKNKTYKDQRVLYRLMRFLAQAVPSILVGLGEAFGYQHLYPQAQDTWDNFYKIALADAGQNLGAEFIGELVLQGLDDEQKAVEQACVEELQGQVLDGAHETASLDEQT